MNSVGMPTPTLRTLHQLQAAKLVLRNWLRNPDYLEAVNQLQGMF